MEMREIEFRAICVETEKFVYGFYVVNGGDYHTIAYQSPDNARALRVHEVDVKTVGQFTGLLDKNGVKIFEGDKVVIRQEIDGHFIDHVSVEKVVSWDRFGWCLQPVRGLMSMPPCLYVSDGESIEIIGNIHEGA
jgi:uncharacterized phage protein (TIGR01671 family)